ncbi:MAG: adenine deaminase C-terminal domain-containing protein [Bacillota bacterium]
MGGGHVLVRDGKVVAKCPLAVGGIMSDRDIPELAQNILMVEEKLLEMGCTLENPLVTLGFISFSGLPFARMTPRGLLDIKNNKIVFPL